MNKKTGRKPLFHVSLQLGTQTFTAKGSTLDEAFQALELPQKITTKGIFNVTYGKNTASIPIYAVAQLKRFAVNKITRSLFAKRMLILVQ